MEQEDKTAVEINNSAITIDNFNDAYFDIHTHLVKNGDKIDSRNGKTYELLNFKTEITNPVARCVGGKSRNINVFFLLAEAMWIFVGRRDVKFLETFNSQMKEYSDDGVYFHAPYGWRLRNYGVHSMIPATEENHHSFGGTDQIAEAIAMLSENPEDRRVVSLIWNPDFDLGVKSKDIPCNDMLMWKIRKNKLHLTISNRSNDLDWGLCTNVFQFSFILEVMSNILGAKVGTQTHNSQSLHLYESNPLTQDLETSECTTNLYDYANTPLIDFDFGDVEDTAKRLETVDFWMKSIISRLIMKIDQADSVNHDEEFRDNLFGFSEFLYFTYHLLEVYIDYKNKVKTRPEVLQKLLDLNNMQIAFKSDYIMLAMNFFVLRYETNLKIARCEKTEELIKKIRETVDGNIGKY